MSRTKRDPGQIVQYEHDEQDNAKRVKMVGTDIAISVDADDGDSVAVQPRVFEYPITDATPVDITACKELKVYGQGSMTLEVSPLTSGDSWVTIGTYTDESPILPVLARRARVTSPNPATILGRGL